MGEIAELEFENHGFLKNHVFLPTEQAGTNICSMVYQDINFKICLSLFGWKENILPNVHIVQCIRRCRYFIGSATFQFVLEGESESILF